MSMAASLMTSPSKRRRLTSDDFDDSDDNGNTDYSRCSTPESSQDSDCSPLNSNPSSPGLGGSIQKIMFTPIIKLDPKEKSVNLQEDIDDVKRGKVMNRDGSNGFIYMDIKQERSAYCIDKLYTNYFFETDLTKLKSALEFVIDSGVNCEEKWLFPSQSFRRHTTNAVKHYLQQCKKQNREESYEDFIKLINPFLSVKVFWPQKIRDNRRYVEKLHEFVSFKDAFEMDKILKEYYKFEYTNDDNRSIFKSMSKSLSDLSDYMKAEFSKFGFRIQDSLIYEDNIDHLHFMERQVTIFSLFLGTFTKKMALLFTDIFNCIHFPNNGGYLLIYSHNLFNCLIKQLLLISNTGIDSLAFLITFLRSIKHIEYTVINNVDHSNHFTFCKPAISHNEFEALLTLISRASYEGDDTPKEKEDRKWVLVEVLLVLKSAFGVNMNNGEDCLLMVDASGVERKVEMKYKDEMLRRVKEGEWEGENYNGFIGRFDDFMKKLEL